MLCAKPLSTRLYFKASQKFGVEHKMASCPTFSLYKIDPETHYDFFAWGTNDIDYLIYPSYTIEQWFPTTAPGTTSAA